jgi:hypothetical protein
MHIQFSLLPDGLMDVRGMINCRVADSLRLLTKHQPRKSGQEHSQTQRENLSSTFQKKQQRLGFLFSETRTGIHTSVMSIPSSSSDNQQTSQDRLDTDNKVRPDLPQIFFRE